VLSDKLLHRMNETRRTAGLLTVEEIADAIMAGNAVYDPFSLLIARTAGIGNGNVFYPGVSLLASNGQTLRIGDGNVFHAQTLIVASHGPADIGDGNQFGDGGFTLQANRPGARILIGDHGRYAQGVRVFGTCRLGSGSQVLGPIVVDSCELAAGASHQEPDPDRRGAVLKGHGLARNITLAIGEVLVGDGRFDPERIERQRAYHPP
jgi:acetyltransferase-like isoleucine patch superfamily enzyme